MKKPIRAANAMGKDRKALGNAKYNAAMKIMDVAFDTQGTRADMGKGKLGGFYKGAKPRAWNLLEAEGKLSKESKQIQKAGERMAKVSDMRKANADKMKKKK